MNAQLNYTMVQHRSDELRRARERARIATEAPARRRRFARPEHDHPSERRAQATNHRA